MAVQNGCYGGMSSRHMLLPVLVLATAVVVTAGCGRERSRAVRVPIRGKVLLDGKPLARGRISFNAMGGEPPAVMDIDSGSYAGQAIVGPNRVMITASKSSSMKKTMGFDGPGYDESVEINTLPARYNLATELEAVVADGGEENSFNFELSSE